jgi:MoaA/NifB/PqqE/SkfB family radical SAM enzyme
MSAPLEEALALARAAATDDGRMYRPTTARAITRRGILWLGLVCNLRCGFCYFLDRIEDPDHPEHDFMSLEKARTICRTLVDYYGNNSIDIQGGEPTLFPGIEALIEFCAGIGLSPTLITNATTLADRELAQRLQRAGIRDFLISIQALGEAADQVAGRAGTHRQQMSALRNLRGLGLPFRFNTVLTRAALAQLGDIARLAAATGAGVVNFLGCNPFNDQRAGRRDAEFVPSYAALRDPLRAAVELLAGAGVEVNVRYLPLCLLPDHQRPHAYGFAQLPYDLHENDYASWSWTDLPAQRSPSAGLSPPFGLGRRLHLGALRGPLRRLDRRWPRLGGGLHAVKQWLERAWAADGAAEDDAAARERLYRADGIVRAREYTGYRHARACRQCSLRRICDGVYSDYATLFGADDVRPVELGDVVTDPQYYTRHQFKVIHPLDQAWLEEAADAAGSPPSCEAPR